MSDTKQTTSVAIIPEDMLQPADIAKEDKESIDALNIPVHNYISCIHFQDVKHEKMRKFLMYFANTGAIGRSAQAAGMAKCSHQQWLSINFRGYNKLFEQAQALYKDRLVAEATRRAVDGVDKPIYFKGKEIGTEKKYSDYLLGLALKANVEEYRERTEITHTTIEAKDSFLSRKQILAELAAELNKLQAKEMAIDVESVEKPADE